MKIGTTNSNTLITSSEQTQRSKFSIQASGKAFQVLSNSLYQFKVRAVVREIGCNAYDAHIEAGNTDTPFKVTLPCKEDPHFKVRDYGIGLPEDKFVEIYTTYFGSTKSDSNDSTGGFGLGSKTPFIMSKVFTVHSYYEGTEYMWHSYVNDNGEPDVVLLTKKATTEPNGLLVIVPIGQGMSDTEKNALFRDFRSEAENVYQWFDTIPNVTVNGANVTIKPRLHGSNSKYSKLKLKGVDNTTVYYETEHSKGSQSQEIFVKMGNVVYPYKLTEVRSLDRFGGNIMHTEAVIKYLTHSGRLNFVNHPLVVEVGMGEVDIAPSREALSLVNTTEVTIINAVCRFVDMYFDQLQHNIDNAKSTFEKYQNLYAIPPISGRTFRIDGKDVHPHAQSPVWAFGTDQALAGRTNFLRSFSVDDLAVKYRRAGTRGIVPLKTSFDMTMYGANLRDRTIVLVDKEYKGELRLWINANTPAESACVVVFGLNDKGNPCPLTDAEMEPFLRDGHPQVVKFSKFANQPVTTSRPGVTSMKLADQSFFSLSGISSYHFFTEGNSRLCDLNKDVQPIDEVNKVIPELYICYKRHASAIIMDVTTDKKNVEPFAIGNWSRSQQSNTSYNASCDFINEVFDTLPYHLHDCNVKKIWTKFKYEIDGEEYTVRKFRHVVMNRDTYDAVVGSDDFPTFVTVDTAIRECILPAIPDDVKVYAYESDMRLDYKDGYGYRFMDTFNLNGITAKVQQIDHLMKNDSVATMINKFNKNPLVQQFGYTLTKKSKVITHRYDFTQQAFWSAIEAAGKDNIPGAADLYNLFHGFSAGGTMSNVFSTNYHIPESVRWGWKVAQTYLASKNYDAAAIQKYVLDYFESKHKVS